MPFRNSKKGELESELENKINEWLELNNVEVLNIGYSACTDGSLKNVLSCIIFYK